MSWKFFSNMPPSCCKIGPKINTLSFSRMLNQRIFGFSDNQKIEIWKSRFRMSSGVCSKFWVAHVKVHQILHFLCSGTFFRIVHHHGLKIESKISKNLKFSKSQNLFFRKTWISRLRFWWDVPFRARYARYGVSTRVATNVFGGLINLITTYRASYAVEPLEQTGSENEIIRTQMQVGSSLTMVTPFQKNGPPSPGGGGRKVFPSRVHELLNFATPLHRANTIHTTPKVFSVGFMSSSAQRARCATNPTSLCSMNVGDPPLREISS